MLKALLHTKKNFYGHEMKTHIALKDKSYLCDLTFLVDVTIHLNEVNANLQTQDQLGHELFGHISHLKASFAFGKVI